MRVTLVTLITLAAACSSAPTMEKEPTQIQVVEIEGRRVATTLGQKDARRVTNIITRMQPSGGWAMTPPPWDAVLVLRYADGRERVLKLTAATLRENTEDPWAMHLAGPDGAPDPAVQDYDIEFEDEMWLWNLFGQHLGPTDVKQYRSLGDELSP